MSLIGTIVVLLVVEVALYLLSMVPMDANIRKIIQVLVILFVVLWVLQALGLLPDMGLRLK